MFFYNESGSEISQQPNIPEDPHFYSTSLLLKMDSDFSDSSTNNHTVTANGDATISSTESKYGGASGEFDGSGDYLTIPGNSSFDFGTGDFTVETWLYVRSIGPTWLSLYDNRNTNVASCLALNVNPSRYPGMFVNGQHVLTSNIAISFNSFHHVAFVRSAGVTTVYVDGQSGGSFNDGNSYSAPQVIVATDMNYGATLDGYIDDFRITKGIARYTANFTPPDSHPTAGPSEIVSDNLTFHLDSSDANSYPGTGTTWTSLVNSSDVGTFVGDPTFNSVEANSIDLDGNGDYVQIDNASLFDFSGDFTIEMSFKMDQIGQTNGGTVILSNNILDNFQISPNVDGNSIRFFIGGEALTTFNTTSNLIGRWCSMTLSRISGVYTVYDNGVNIGTATNSASINSSQLFLGVQTPSRVPFYAHFTDGKIGSFRVYGDGLTEAEVLQNFNATKNRFGL